MELRYADRNLEKICTDVRRMRKTLGAQVARALTLRLAELTYVEEMADLRHGTGRWEELQADRTGQWSARLTGNWRLIVEPDHSDGVVVLVVEIVDYHR